MSTALVRCVDSRYSQAGVRGALPHAYDFTCAGASLHLVTDEEWRQSWLRQLQQLNELGVGLEHLIIADHFSQDGRHGCRAYHDNDSRDRHVRNLLAARRLIKEHMSLPVCLLLHDIEKGMVEEI